MIKLVHKCLDNGSPTVLHTLVASSLHFFQTTKGLYTLAIFHLNIFNVATVSHIPTKLGTKI